MRYNISLEREQAFVKHEIDAINRFPHSRRPLTSVRIHNFQWATNQLSNRILLLFHILVARSHSSNNFPQPKCWIYSCIQDNCESHLATRWGDGSKFSSQWDFLKFFYFSLSPSLFWINNNFLHFMEKISIHLPIFMPHHPTEYDVWKWETRFIYTRARKWSDCTTKWGQPTFSSMRLTSLCVHTISMALFYNKLVLALYPRWTNHCCCSHTIFLGYKFWYFTGTG